MARAPGSHSGSCSGGPKRDICAWGPLLPPQQKSSLVTRVFPVSDAPIFAWSFAFRRFCLQGFYPGIPTISFRRIRYPVGVGLRPDTHHRWSPTPQPHLTVLEVTCCTTTSRQWAPQARRDRCTPPRAACLPRKTRRHQRQAPGRSLRCRVLRTVMQGRVTGRRDQPGELTGSLDRPARRHSNWSSHTHCDVLCGRPPAAYRQLRPTRGGHEQPRKSRGGDGPP